MVFHSVNFPENINFKIGDLIWISDFDKFLEKGYLYSPDNTDDYAELNDKAVNSEISQAQLLRAYHMKLRKLLKPETLYYYYQAERKFKRKLLQNMPKNMPPPPDEELKR